MKIFGLWIILCASFQTNESVVYEVGVLAVDCLHVYMYVYNKNILFITAFLNTHAYIHLYFNRRYKKGASQTFCRSSSSSFIFRSNGIWSAALLPLPFTPPVDIHTYIHTYIHKRTYISVHYVTININYNDTELQLNIPHVQFNPYMHLHIHIHTYIHTYIQLSVH